MELAKLIKENNLETLFKEANFGIEKEGLRTNQEQKQATTPRSKLMGDRSFHPYMQSDFSEVQPELVTPVKPSLKEAYEWLESLHDVLFRSMAEDEYLWPNSMPNILPEEDEIPIARLDSDSVHYREILAERYGKKKQMISGIHFNFSFSEAFINALFDAQDETSDKTKFQNDIYIKLAGNFLKYEWVLLYLFGASPYAHETFYDEKSAKNLKIPTNYVRSLRNSSFGYHNHDEVVVRYDSVKHYVEDIENYVETNHLSEEREFYGNARLRGTGTKLREMLADGVEYVEFRSIDINPLDRLGISYEQGLFYHLFFMLMVWLDTEATTDDIIAGQEKNIQTSDEYPYDSSQYKDQALALLGEMKTMVQELSLADKFIKLVEKAVDKFHHPETTLAARVADDIEEKGYLNHGRELGLEYKQYSLDRPYVLNGFDDMELSTQLLLFDALQLGVEVEIIDRSDHFLKLSHQDHIEYVRNGNMTSKDTQISYFIMENKTVTKKILHEHGYEVPQGGEYQSVEEAVGNYEKYKNKGIVVKPKSTNYGIGISIFKESATKESFKEAVEIAFEEDDAILVEEFVAGTEYRFFVLDGEVGAVLLRVPANVVGDGESTIGELIDEKNEDPLREANHRGPLAIIEKGSIEKLMLKEQGYTFDSVLEKDQQVFLRENSNISTGGDSIDFTTEMHESYNAVAVGIAEALDVRVTGIDLIIPDYETPSTNSAPGYSCIEANFNPAMNMHAYVTKGEGRRLSEGVLAMLFPELTEATDKIK
jgi:glutamate--cysteine ligase/energy-coupling factor transport system ATP-binding protein